MQSRSRSRGDMTGKTSATFRDAIRTTKHRGQVARLHQHSRGVITEQVPRTSGLSGGARDMAAQLSDDASDGCWRTWPGSSRHCFSPLLLYTRGDTGDATICIYLTQTSLAFPLDCMVWTLSRVATRDFLVKGVCYCNINQFHKTFLQGKLSSQTGESMNTRSSEGQQSRFDIGDELHPLI
jgi:hypothetical protein